MHRGGYLTPGGSLTPPLLLAGNNNTYQIQNTKEDLRRWLEYSRCNREAQIPCNEAGLGNLHPSLSWAEALYITSGGPEKQKAF